MTQSKNCCASNASSALVACRESGGPVHRMNFFSGNWCKRCFSAAYCNLVLKVLASDDALGSASSVAMRLHGEAVLEDDDVVVSRQIVQVELTAIAIAVCVQYPEAPIVVRIVGPWIATRRSRVRGLLISYSVPCAAFQAAMNPDTPNGRTRLTSDLKSVGATRSHIRRGVYERRLAIRSHLYCGEGMQFERRASLRDWIASIG